MKVLRKIGSELGVVEIWSASPHARKDILLLYFIRAIRLFGFGLSTSILVLHLRFDLGWSDVFIGSFISVTLLGNAVMALLVTQLISLTGQRRMLSAGPLGMVLSGLIFYKSSSPPVLLLAAVLGVISPVANEVSPYQAVDIAVLSQLVPDKTRVQIFTSYMFAGAISSAIGGVVTGAVIHHYLPLVGASEAYRRVFLVFSAGGLLALLASFAVSSQANLPNKETAASKPTPDEDSPLLPDQPADQPKPDVSPLQDEPKLTARFGVPIVVVLSIVSGVDTFASAIASPSYIAYDLKDRFNPPIQTITTTISLCGLLAGISFLIAAPLARRFGVLTTMFSSHIIAQIFLISYGLATNMHLSIILVLIRASFAVLEMPPRTAFYSSIIAPENRARHLGYINLARTLTAAAGPFVDGWLAARGVIWLAFIVSGVLKLIAYDGGLGLFFAFRQKKEGARA